MEKRRIEPENPRSYTVCRAQQKGLSVADDVMVVEDVPSLCCTDEELTPDLYGMSTYV